MDKGEAKYSGHDVSKGIDQYYSRFSTNDTNIIYDDGSFELNEIEIKNSTNVDGIPQVKWNTNLTLELTLKSKTDFIPSPTLNIYDKEQRPVASVNQKDFQAIKSNSQIITYTIVLPKLQLSKGIYNLELVVHESKASNIRLRIRQIISFQILHDQDTWPPLLIDGLTNLVEQ